MSSVVEDEIRKNDDFAQASGDSVKAMEKEEELSQKLASYLDHNHLFHRG